MTHFHSRQLASTISKVGRTRITSSKLLCSLKVSPNHFLSINSNICRYYSEGRNQIKYDLDLINEQSEQELQREFTPEFEQELSTMSSKEIMELVYPILETQNYNKSYYYLRHWYDPKKVYSTPEDAMALAMFGSNLNIFGFTEEAKSVLKKAISLYETIYANHGSSESESFKRLMIELGEMETIFKLLEFTANGSLGNIFFAEQNYDSAVVYLRKACEMNNTDDNLMPMLAISYANTNQPKRAISVFNQLLEHNPEDEILINRVGSFYESALRDYDNAEKYYKKSLEVNPHNANNRYIYGVFLKHIRNNEEACIKELKECLVANGRFWPAHTVLGEILCNRGKYAEAAPYLENSVQNDRNIEGRHYILAAKAFMELNDDQKAEGIYSQYIQNAKGSHYADPEVFFAYADFLKRVDRARSAQQVYKAILSFPELPKEITKRAENLLKEVEKK